MSIWFISTSGEDLWNPSLGAGEFFVAGVRLLESSTRVMSGISDPTSDEVAVDPEALSRFVKVCQSRLTHPTMKAQAMGVIAISMVLLQRAGFDQRIERGWEQLVPIVKSLAAAMAR